MALSPYSTKFASGEIDHNLDPRTQMRKYKKEEYETYKAPNILPYELGDLPEYYSNVVDNAMQASRIIENALKTNEIRNKKELLELKQNTDKIVYYLVKNVDRILEKQTIGATHVGDEDEKIKQLANEGEIE